MNAAGLGEYLDSLLNDSEDHSGSAGVSRALAKSERQKADKAKTKAAETEEELFGTGAEEEDAEEEGNDLEGQEEAEEEEECEKEAGMGEDHEQEEEEEDEAGDEEENEEQDLEEPELEGDELAKAAKETTKGKGVRNSETHKKEWDKFAREAQNKKTFPVSLMPAFRKNKNDLFGIWLDNGMSWERTEIAVVREQESKNLARSEMVGVQAKDIRAKLGNEKADQVIEARKAAGLYYLDDDFPTDPEEIWYYMPAGRLIRQDNSASEKMTAKATSSDQDLFNAMIETALPAGALPAVKAATEAGAKKLLEAIDDEGKAVAKVKAKKPQKGESTPPTQKPSVQRPIILRLANDKIPATLDQAAKARKISLELQGVEYASELSQQLKQHAVLMEKFFLALQKAVGKQPPCMKTLKELITQVDAKFHWYAKAEVNYSDQPQPVSAYVLLPHEVLHAVRDLVNETIAKVTAWSLEHEDYPELGSRFKAAHIKIMVWWVAVKVEDISQKLAPCLARSCE
ncbi:30S ribosomal protein S6 [Durusdinium trenchii]|uniref:30S ribosomal protein S6 n=1 Tax=Durusdinium trenchii TaxID=1381693 RepID=A0ABP0N7Z0_9DINO